MNEHLHKPTVVSQPYSIPIELRPLWRMSLIVCAIVVVSGEKRYLDTKKVNVLVWMLIRRSLWDQYRAYLLNETNRIPLVSVDTATYKAIEFLMATELVNIEGDRILVTDAGFALYHAIEKADVMLEERNFLNAIGRKLTEDKVRRLTGGAS